MFTVKSVKLNFTNIHLLIGMRWWTTSRSRRRRSSPAQSARKSSSLRERSLGTNKHQHTFYNQYRGLYVLENLPPPHFKSSFFPSILEMLVRIVFLPLDWNIDI